MFKLLRRLLLLLVVLAVAVLGLGWSLDSIARKGIERGGSWALGVPVTAGSARIALMSGDFGVAGFRVDNPPGFSGEPFFSVARIESRVPVADLLGDPITVQKIELRGIHVSLEQNLSRSNWSVITDNLKRFETGEKKPESGGRRFIVKELVLEDVKVGAALVAVAGSAVRRTIELPPIRLRDVGAEGGKGALIAEVTAVVVEAVLGAVATHGGGLLPPDAAADLGSRVRSVLDPATGAMIENAIKDLPSDPAKVIKGIGDLLGGRKK
jgi:hypothetical protein